MPAPKDAELAVRTSHHGAHGAHSDQGFCTVRSVEAPVNPHFQVGSRMFF